jgi:hypothetical protein
MLASPLPSRDRGGTAQSQLLDVRTQRVGDESLDRVAARSACLIDDIAGVIDIVAIVAQSTAQGVGTTPSFHALPDRERPARSDS